MRLDDCVLHPLLNRLDSPFSVETVLDHVVCEHEFVKLPLQVVVLECEDIGMILKSVQLLLVAVASLEQTFVALAYCFELSADAAKLGFELGEPVLCFDHVVVEILPLLALPISLPDQLALGLHQVSIALIVSVTVLLQALTLILAPGNLCSSDVKLAARVVQLHTDLMVLLVHRPYPIVELIQLVGLLV